MESTDEISVEVKRVYSKVFSLFFTEEFFPSRPFIMHSDAVYDSMTGKELSLQDVITDTKAILQLFVDKAEIDYCLITSSLMMKRKLYSVHLRGVQKGFLHRF